MIDDEEAAASYSAALEAKRVPLSSTTEATGYSQEEIAPPSTSSRTRTAVVW